MSEGMTRFGDPGNSARRAGGDQPIVFRNNSTERLTPSIGGNAKSSCSIDRTSS
jgi:hypothetical protein